MKYRAKITYCIPQVLNIEKYVKSPICTDANDTYIEVTSEREAELIEGLNDLYKKAFNIYEALIDETTK